MPSGIVSPAAGTVGGALSVPEDAIRKLLAAGSGDAALLYLYLESGRDPLQAQSSLQLTAHRLDSALALLRQLGLAPEKPRYLEPGERPVYTEADITREMNAGKSFPNLVGEVQRRFGRVLSTEELKILLSMRDYLHFSDEMIFMIICYCSERSRARGNVRGPSMRAIEKEAYYWADNSIDTFEEAAAYMHRQLQRQSRIGSIRRILQIHDRHLTPGEEGYVLAWIDMGFGDREIEEAYNRTCMGAGSLKWPYMNSILKNWASRGLYTLERIRLEDRSAESAKKSKFAAQDEAIDPMVLKSIRKRLGKDSEEET